MPGIDEALRDAGARWRSEQREVIVDLDQASSPRRSRAVVFGATASAVAIAAIGLVALLADRPAGRAHVTVKPATTPSTVAGSGPDVIELNSEIVQPDILAVDGNEVWVAGYAPTLPGKKHQGPAHLQEFDATSGRMQADVTLPDDSPGSLRISPSAVWLSGQQDEVSAEYLKLDPSTMRIVVRIPSIKGGPLVVTPDAVWATDGLGGLRRFDPVTGRVEATIDLHSNSFYPPLWDVGGPLGLFVGNGYNGTIQRIDTDTNTAGPELHVAPDLADMVELGGSLWVVRSDGSQIVEIRGGTTVVRTLDLPGRTFGLASDGKALWLGTATSRVLRVDPATGLVGSVAMPAGTSATTVAADPITGAVWATSMTPTPRILRVPADQG